MTSQRDLLLKRRNEQNKKQDIRERKRSVICTSDGSRTLGASPWADENNKIVYHQLFGSGGVGRAKCISIANPEVGLGVEVAKIDDRLADWEVVGVDPFLRPSATDPRNYGVTGPNDLQPGGRLMLWVDSRQIEPLATWDTAGTLQVNVTAGDYPYLGARKSFAGQNGINLAASVPGGGLTRYVGLYLDASNTLQTVNGATTTIGLTPAEPTWPAGAFRLSVVQLDNGQTSIDFDDDIFDRRMAWSDDNSGGGGTAATQAEVDAGTNTTKFVTPSTLANFAPLEFRVKNTSGSTVTPGWVGYIVWTSGSGLEFKATTTGSADVATACTVLVGAANNADIIVASRGRFSLLYSGTAPSQGDFLIFNGSGAVVRQTYMSPDVMAVAMAAGSGGSVDALMLTRTSGFIPLSSANKLYEIFSSASAAFTGTISGTPTATSVVYTVSTGNENALGPGATTDLAKLRLYNSTRANYRLITAVNTGTNTITTVSSTDDWANGDSLTIASPTINDGLSPPFTELDLSNQTEIPVLVRSIVPGIILTDSGGIGGIVQLHPYEVYSAAKTIPFGYTQTTQSIAGNVPVPLINQKFGIRSVASGAATLSRQMTIIGFYLAVP